LHHQEFLAAQAQQLTLQLVGGVIHQESFVRSRNASTSSFNTLSRSLTLNMSFAIAPHSPPPAAIAVHICLNSAKSAADNGATWGQSSVGLSACNVMPKC
jgi:hypothetical protein